jgi:hypothetical protein
MIRRIPANLTISYLQHAQDLVKGTAGNTLVRLQKLSFLPRPLSSSEIFNGPSRDDLITKMPLTPCNSSMQTVGRHKSGMREVLARTDRIRWIQAQRHIGCRRTITSPWTLARSRSSGHTAVRTQESMRKLRKVKILITSTRTVRQLAYRPPLNHFSRLPSGSCHFRVHMQLGRRHECNI